MSSLGVVLFHALDYGLNEDKERSLSKPLERLIEKLTTESARHDERGQAGHGSERSDDEGHDEGIVNDDEDEQVAGGGHKGSTFDDIVGMCEDRIGLESAESHYRMVCRALVAEALELSTFLDVIASGTQELRKSSVVAIADRSAQEANPNLEQLEFCDWARLWMQVVKDLRRGVTLKKIDVDSLHHHHHMEYELTPYEMLLEDIRSRRYKLNKVMVNGDIPARVRKDAHALILEFIRSRPPLVPVSKRKLPPAPPSKESLYEKLMQSIRQKHHLRPTPPSSAQHTPCRSSSAFQLSTPAESESTTATPSTKTSQRRLIKPDLALSLTDFSREDYDLGDDTGGHRSLNDYLAGHPHHRYSLSNEDVLSVVDDEEGGHITLCSLPMSSTNNNYTAANHKNRLDRSVTLLAANNKTASRRLDRSATIGQDLTLMKRINSRLRNLKTFFRDFHV